LLAIFAQAEIYQLDVANIIGVLQHQILQLDVSMANPVVLQIDERAEALVHDDLDVLLAQILAFKDVVEELSPMTDVCDDKKHLVPLPNLVHVDDVWVVNLTEHAILLLE
jgi:hypothetical protein